MTDDEGYLLTDDGGYLLTSDQGRSREVETLARRKRFFAQFMLQKSLG